MNEEREANLDVVGLEVDEKEVSDDEPHGYPYPKSAKP